MIWSFYVGKQCWSKMAKSLNAPTVCRYIGIPLSVLLPWQCQGVAVYLSLWHYVGLSVCVSICLHPSVLTPVQQTIRANQFLARPVCQSFCLGLFVCSLYHRVSLSVTLCFFHPFIHPSIRFVHLLGWSWTFGFTVIPPRVRWFLHLIFSPPFPASTEFIWAVWKRWIVSFLTPVTVLSGGLFWVFSFNHTAAVKKYE